MSLRTIIYKHIPLSCGVRLLGQIDAGKSFDVPLTAEKNAERVVRIVAHRRWRRSSHLRGLVNMSDYVSNEYFSQVVFSHRENDVYCSALLDFIRKHRLGTVTKSPVVLNSNSGSLIRTYIWNLDEDALQEWSEPPERKRTAAPSQWTRQYW